LSVTYSTTKLSPGGSVTWRAVRALHAAIAALNAVSTFRRRNHEPVPVAHIAWRYRTASRERLVEAHDDVLKVLLGIRWRTDVVQRSCLVVERELGPLQHSHARDHGVELLAEIGTPEPEQRNLGRVGAGAVSDVRDERRPELRYQRGRALLDLGERDGRRVGLRLPLGRPVVRVDVIAVMLPDGERELHVRLGDLIHARRVRWREKGSGNWELQAGSWVEMPGRWGGGAGEFQGVRALEFGDA
jgi:hypothetical protein